MAAVGEMVTGKGARRQAKLAEEAAARQRAEIDAEKARLKALEDGQMANAQTGGIGGLLAYVDRNGKVGSKLGGEVG